MTEENSKESGSFLNGFMLGIAAGAVGYFAFGTRKGSDLRRRLQEEWQSARETLQKESTDQVEESVVGSSIFAQAKGFIENSIAAFDVLKNDVVLQGKQLSKKQKPAKKSRFKGT